ncbi:MAG: Na+/H+ antiporter subunit G [Comamonadaceae bacterium]|nr:MAG: Na+/H+ antiporter subunit G [Comamonadaceae bacterium]
MSGAVPMWIELLVAALLLANGVAALVGAIGLVRLKDFFQRMHPPALAYTLGAWCVSLASILYFSMMEGRLALHAWLIIILLSVATPVTTTLLARAALFRMRAAVELGGDPPGRGEEAPPHAHAAAVTPATHTTRPPSS